MSVRLESHAEGVVLPVRAKPAARRSGLEGVRDGALLVLLSEAPERGKANKALIALLSKELHLSKSQIELLSGQKGRHKRLLVRGIDISELARRLHDALGESVE